MRSSPKHEDGDRWVGRRRQTIVMVVCLCVCVFVCTKAAAILSLSYSFRLLLPLPLPLELNARPLNSMHSSPVLSEWQISAHRELIEISGYSSAAAAAAAATVV